MRYERCQDGGEEVGEVKKGGFGIRVYSLISLDRLFRLFRLFSLSSLSGLSGREIRLSSLSRPFSLSGQ